MNKIEELTRLGQSVWIDYIRRSFLTSGGLQYWIDQGLRGMTSNPSIFEKAIVESDDYTQDLQALARAGKSKEEIFDSLAQEDIRQAADIFRPLFDRAGGKDGFVSLEVNPLLANNTHNTIKEALRLWQDVDRPNLMVKIPATHEGLAAITAATAQGVNVNITLIFSIQRYADVMAAYLAGLQQRVHQSLPVDHIHSVASFFVSRIDTKVDKRLEAIMQEGGERGQKAAALRGKAAVASARIAYSHFKEMFDGQSFADLRRQGANLQRPLWASTSTKNPAYSDILYVQTLIGPHTINTMPEKTLKAFLDHGEVRNTLEDNLADAQMTFQSLEDLGVSIDDVTHELEVEGVKAFSKSFESLMESISEKRKEYSH